MRKSRNLFFLIMPLFVLGAGCASQEIYVSDDAVEVTDFQMLDDTSEDSDSDLSDTQEGDDVDSIKALPDESETTDTQLASAVFDIQVGDYFFEPKNLMVASGQEVQITFTESTGTHTFVIDEIGLKTSVSDGKAITFIAPASPGRYYFYCDIGAHRQLGMEGVLVVE